MCRWAWVLCWWEDTQLWRGQRVLRKDAQGGGAPLGHIALIRVLAPHPDPSLPSSIPESLTSILRTTWTPDPLPAAAFGLAPGRQPRADIREWEVREVRGWLLSPLWRHVRHWLHPTGRQLLPDGLSSPDSTLTGHLQEIFPLLTPSGYNPRPQHRWGFKTVSQMNGRNERNKCSFLITSRSTSHQVLLMWTHSPRGGGGELLPFSYSGT